MCSMLVTRELPVFYLEPKNKEARKFEFGTHSIQIQIFKLAFRAFLPFFRQTEWSRCNELCTQR